MNILDKINEEIKKVKKNGNIPTRIWLGTEEKYELQKLIKNTIMKDIQDGENLQNQICGLPYSFVSSERWLSVAYDEK